jgi:hypothetical protein
VFGDAVLVEDGIVGQCVGSHRGWPILQAAMLSLGDARSFDAQVEACLLGSRFRLLITKLVRDAFAQ